MTPPYPASVLSIPHHDTSKRPPIPARLPSNPNLLSPDTALDLLQTSRRLQQSQKRLEYDRGHDEGFNGDGSGLRGSGKNRRRAARSNSRRGRAVWKKLLWVKQKDYPDNYTDPPTFLSHLQRNHRLRPYDFWPLVADSTTIVQHLSTVAIFVCSFVGIYQQRVSPVSVVSWGSACTVLGWISWDIWMEKEAKARTLPGNHILGGPATGDFVNGSAISTSSSPNSTSAPPLPTSVADASTIGLGLNVLTGNSQQPGDSHVRKLSQNSVSSDIASSTTSRPSSQGNFFDHTTTHAKSYNGSDRMHQRLATAKSAILIYTALLGLSPILKSLTESTSSDSIWALSTWLMLLHIFFFDYSGSSTAPTPTSSTNNSAKFPASLSTNAALMASTVLASRLPSTTHVFSLTLFSIEVFGLFPVWRRCLRHLSWRGHLILTFSLVIGAGAGLGLVISGRRIWSEGGWKRALAGILIWNLVNAVGMGGCSWWLIGLQRYKDVVIGPWDPARPIIRGGWD